MEDNTSIMHAGQALASGMNTILSKGELTDYSMHIHVYRCVCTVRPCLSIIISAKVTN